MGLPLVHYDPVEEIYLGPNVRCKNVSAEDDHWLVTSETGAILKVSTTDLKPKKVIDFPSGSINAMCTVQKAHVEITLAKSAKFDEILAATQVNHAADEETKA